MDFYIILASLIPMVMLNIWHSLLLWMPNDGNKPHTISHHAASSRSTLRTHRFMHTTASIILAFFGVMYLLPHGYLLAGWLILAASTFDILEVVTLNKNSATEIATLNYHAVTAWAMALCYLLYASAAIQISGLPAYTTALVWGSFAVLLVIAILRKFRSFWIIQHLYFCFLALVMIAAHILLLF